MQHLNTKHLTVTAVFTAIICVISVISIPVGTVPVTISVFAICLSALCLPKMYGVLAVVTYIFLGIAGLPVFSGGNAGIGAFLTPLGGYILGYIPFCVITAFFKNKICKNAFLNAFTGGILGLLALYIFGTVWFAIYTKSTVITAITVCVLPFAVLDILKIWCAVLCAKKINTALKRIIQSEHL